MLQSKLSSIEENNYVCVVLNIVYLNYMKIEAVGSITKGGGFSRLIREVDDSKEPVQIIRNNVTVAMVVPANADFVKLFEESMNFGKVLRIFADKGMLFEMQRYLLGQIMIGIQAKALLTSTTGVSSDMITAAEEVMFASMREAIAKELQKAE